MRLYCPLLAILALASPADAQIYSWRDAAGALVLSNTPPAGLSNVQAHAISSARTALPGRIGPTPYDELIHTHALAQGVSPDLVKAVIQVESAFNPRAVSAKGAKGLMQLMPATARELGVADPFQPEQNIRGGIAYLRQLLDRYDQDVPLALAAYNAGPGAVERYGTIPPFRETRSYVQKVTTAAPAAPPGTIFKWMEIVDGRPVPRYSNTPPAGIAYEIVGRR
ncbi:MAG: lytic transglycosylase domain-containing protein [Acidobacteriota bacterium]